MLQCTACFWVRTFVRCVSMHFYVIHCDVLLCIRIPFFSMRFYAFLSIDLLTHALWCISTCSQPFLTHALRCVFMDFHAFLSDALRYYDALSIFSSDFFCIFLYQNGIPFIKKISIRIPWFYWKFNLSSQTLRLFSLVPILLPTAFINRQSIGMSRITQSVCLIFSKTMSD